MSDRSDRPRVKHVKPEDEDPWEMKRKPKKPGIKVSSRALRWPDRE